MSGSFNVDIEAGLVSEKSKFVGTTTGPCSSNTPRKACEFYPTQPREQQATLILESWDGSAESILLFAGLFSMVVSLFIIEGYQRLSPDGADQAVALFDQLSRLVGIPAGTPFDPSQAAASFKPNPSAVRATTLWFLSLGMNVTCVVWVLWLQFVDPRGEPHAHARALAYPCSRTGRVNLGYMAEVLWMILESSALLFLVGLLDFVHPINTTIAWILLGYLALLASLHAARALLRYRFPSLHHPTISPDSA